MQETVLTKAKRGSARVSSVEFWRFVFTVLVCFYHQEILFMEGKALPSGTSAVEFFFLLAGFLLAMSANHSFQKHPEPFDAGEARAKALDFVRKKLKVIYPVVVLALLLYIFTTVMGDGNRIKALMDMDWDLLLLVGTPMGYRNGMAPIVPLWFLTVLLIVGYAYTYFIHRHQQATLFAAPLIGILGYSYFLMNSTLVLDFMEPMGFLTSGMVKGIAEMGLGVSLFCLYDYLSKKDFSAIPWKIFFSVIELYAIYRFFALTLHQPLGADNFRRVIYIMIIILMSFLNVTWLTQFLDNKVSRLLGRFTLAMYVSHFTVATAYFFYVSGMKMKTTSFYVADTSAHALASKFLRNMGGFENGVPIPISWKDRVFYIILVLLAGVVITFLGEAIQKIARSAAQSIAESRAEKEAQTK